METRFNNIFESNDSKDSLIEMKEEYNIPSEEFISYCDAVTSKFAQENFNNPNQHINAFDVITVLREAIGIGHSMNLVGDNNGPQSIEEAVKQAYEKHIIGYDDAIYDDESLDSIMRNM